MSCLIGMAELVPAIRSGSVPDEEIMVIRDIVA
jgi:hypothetical protein